VLYDKLKEYAAGGVYPMHMPGHKRNTGLLPPGIPYDIDITEIYGFDDLSEPSGVLLATARLAASLYGSKKAFPLINGSTVGILSSIGAHTSYGDKMLIAGTCHRAVYNAATLFGLETICIIPQTDEATGIELSIEPADIEAALKKDPDTKLVVLTSPTYEGVISDIKTIAEVVHSYGIPLFVDGAHGAHLDFCPWLKGSRASYGGDALAGGSAYDGADVVVMSLHKTLPALTQCSLLHVYGEYARPDEIARMLNILQTSSPSYVLMASIDHCLRLLETDKDRLFLEYKQNLDSFSQNIAELNNLYVLCHGKNEKPRGLFAFDMGKLVIATKNKTLSGAELISIIRSEFEIELEMIRPNYALAMTSICDTAEGFNRLSEALTSLDRQLP